MIAGDDISDKAPERRERGQLAGLTTQLGDNALAIIGVVTSIAGFVGLLASGQLRDFVKIYPYPICISLIIVLLAFLVSLNYARTVRRQRNRLQAAVRRPREPQPSAHDVRLFAEVLADLPLDGPVIAWLRRTDVSALDPANVPADVLTALERTTGRLNGRPVGFDNNAVGRALALFLAVVEDYRIGLESWTLMLHSANQLDHGQGTPPGGTGPVADRLAGSHGRLLSAYDSFVVTAHEHGLDI
jgi:hypothetical protein